MFGITAQDLQIYVIMAPGLLIALVLHELAHGFVAYLLGDPTAKSMGRLSLNPLKHLDPLGTIAFFLFRFGWAKPVPIDPRYFKNPRQGMALTALAGPGMNFTLAILFAVLVHLLAGLGLRVSSPLFMVFYYGVVVNLILGTFNLLPLPPLDGSKILAYFLPPQMAYSFLALGRYGFVILIGIILLSNFTGFSLVGRVIWPVVTGAARLLGVPM